MTNPNDHLIEIAKSVANIDSLAVLSLLMKPAEMTLPVFVSLQKLTENMDMESAQGHDCNTGFYEKRRQIGSLMDASPWTLSNDHGFVLKADLPDLDAEAGVKSMIDEMLPPWAIGRTTEWTEIGAQLRTKDGRRCGNAVVSGQKDYPAVLVVTDVGSSMTLNEQELMGLFHQPEYKVDINEHPGVRKFLGLPTQLALQQLLTDETWVTTCTQRDVDVESQRNLMWSVIKNAGLTDALYLALDEKHPIDG